MQQGYIVLHNYPSLSLMLITYIIIDSHTKIDFFKLIFCFFIILFYFLFLHILNSISKGALMCHIHV